MLEPAISKPQLDGYCSKIESLLRAGESLSIGGKEVVKVHKGKAHLKDSEPIDFRALVLEAGGRYVIG